MARIAICDSDALAARKLNDSIRECLRQSGISIETIYYKDASFLREYLLHKEEILRHKDSPCDFDYIFTEAWLTGGDSDYAPSNILPLLAKLKQEIPDMNFIVVTGHSELIFDALRIPVYYFVRKDYLEQDLDAVCAKFRQDLRKRPKFYVFQTKTRMVRTAVADILYMESFRHTIMIHTLNGSFDIVQPLGSLYTQFEPYDFVQIHKSYLVNMLHIQSIEGLQITLSDGTSLLASRHRLVEIHGKYDTYIRRLGWLR